MTFDKSMFYKANIHEQRIAAVVCRAAPGLSVLITLALSLYGYFASQLVLLWITAVLNMCLWIWIVTTSLQCMYASLFMLKDLERGPGENPIPARVDNMLANVRNEDRSSGGGTGECMEFGSTSELVHLIVLPNYKEGESMLAETLRSLAEAEDSKAFWIYLAIEAREGTEGQTKAERLKMRFENDFGCIEIATHPSDLVERHRDGTENAEVAGKASNVKYAVKVAYEKCLEVGIQHESVVLTVADADSIFHPLYFSRVGHQFSRLRQTGQHAWTMWCAPQFPYRNFWTSPIVSRVWGYVQSTYEFGGLSGTEWGAHHMVFSAYSMPLSLARNAEAWDGDVIAEDHHASLRCFYYWLYTAASSEPLKDALLWHPSIPTLRLRPIFLPVKSTSVASDQSYGQSWVERWSQAKRHARGVSELSYALLATYDAFWTCLLPKRMMSWTLLFRMVQAILRVWCMHVLPICQTISLVTLSIKWFSHNRNIELCPDRIWFFGNLANWRESERYLLCGFAGAWVLTWPVVIPWLLIVASNVLLIYKSFLRPATLNRYASIWHSEDGKVPGEPMFMLLKTFSLVFFDCLFGMWWILLPYGFLVQLIAYVNVFLYGNLNFDYVTASKGDMPGTSKKNLGVGYGAVDEASVVPDDGPTQSEKQEITIA